MIGWCSQFSLFQKYLSLSPLVEIRTLQGACLLHAVILIFILFTHSWPERLIPDIINTIAWLPIFIYLLFRKWINSEIGATSIPLFTVILLVVSWGFLKLNLPTLASIQQAQLFHQTLLISHITTLIAGYILFGISCISSILFLYQEHQIKTKLVKVLIHRFPSLTTLDQISHRTVTMGFLFFTLGLIWEYCSVTDCKVREISGVLELYCWFGCFTPCFCWNDYFRDTNNDSAQSGPSSLQFCCCCL